MYNLSSDVISALKTLGVKIIPIRNKAQYGALLNKTRCQPHNDTSATYFKTGAGIFQENNDTLHCFNTINASNTRFMEHIKLNIADPQNSECALYITRNSTHCDIDEMREHSALYVLTKDYELLPTEAIGNSLNRNKHFINVSDIDEIDYYHIALRFGVSNPMVHDIIKTCLSLNTLPPDKVIHAMKDIETIAKRMVEIHSN